MSSALRWAALSVALVSSAALAEQHKINIHLEPSLGFGLNDGSFVSGGAAKVDTTFFNLGPVAPQFEFFGFGAPKNLLSDGNAFGGGIGLRLRLLNDETGYLISPEGNRGSAWGNLWLDAHLNYAHGNLGLGFDAALGTELSLLDGLGLGPFVKFLWLGGTQVLQFGLCFTVGAPSEIPADADPDKDGIKGNKDKCPHEPEDFDQFQDDDGCPDPDNDGDGILDAADKCPLQPEDKDGFEDADGCPDPDNDHDGVLDVNDKCPLQPEDVDGFEDADGCPDPDNDGDGILDAADKCPLQPEDKDGFEDEDGCPDPDNDGDGILDAVDKCPNEAETFNGVDDEDGCPEKEATVFVVKEKVVITEKIQFGFNQANILPVSNGLLDSVASVLTKFSDIKKVRIEGHTDNVGSAAYNQSLSERRAKAVLDALVKRGIVASRLEPKGYGKTKPLVEGKDDASREKNRRVEFIIVEEAAP